MEFGVLKKFLSDIVSISREQGEESCYEQLEIILKNLTEERKNLTKEKDEKEIEKFREEILPFILESDFGSYIFRKPLGYAGDYYSQEMIWFGRTGSSEKKYIGSTKRGKLISSLSFNMNACKASVERIFYLKDKIQIEGNNIASIGCGSSIELWDLQNFINENNYNVFLLDQEEKALNRGKIKLSNVKNDNINFYKENILKFILNKDNQLLNGRGLIYVSGMLDYFSTKNSKRIVESLWQFIKSGGLLIITNATPLNPTKFWMEYAGDWFLDYKTEDEMYSLGEDLEGVSKINVQIDSQNVHQYLEIRKE